MMKILIIYLLVISAVLAGPKPVPNPAPNPAPRKISLPELFALLNSLPKVPLLTGKPAPQKMVDLSRQDDPQSLLGVVYEHLKHTRGTDPILCNQVFEPGLSKAILADQVHGRGKMRKLTNDPLLCAAQLPMEMGPIRTNHLKKDTAGCAATFYYGPKKTNPHMIKIHLTKINGIWKIHDVHHQDRRCAGGICSVRKTLGLKG